MGVPHPHESPPPLGYFSFHEQLNVISTLHYSLRVSSHKQVRSGKVLIHFTE